MGTIALDGEQSCDPAGRHDRFARNAIASHGSRGRPLLHFAGSLRAIAKAKFHSSAPGLMEPDRLDHSAQLERNDEAIDRRGGAISHTTAGELHPVLARVRAPKQPARPLLSESGSVASSRTRS